MVAGDTTDITIRVSFTCPEPEGERIRVWIDWDGSRTFDDQEMVIDFNLTMSSSETFVITVPVPNTSFFNPWMRAVVIWPGTLTPKPKGDPYYSADRGDVEDYNLSVAVAAVGAYRVRGFHGQQKGHFPPWGGRVCLWRRVFRQHYV